MDHDLEELARLIMKSATITAPGDGADVMVVVRVLDMDEEDADAEARELARECGYDEFHGEDE